MINIRYALIRDTDISNGDGIRISLFVQGCNFHCKNCFNKDTWDFNGGKEWTKEIETEFIKLCLKPHIKAISILGGEPLQQDADLLNLLKRIKLEVKKPISLWTGYEFNEIPEDKKDILNYIDYITDGRFVEELKNYKLSYKGSSNQQLLIKNKKGGWDYK